MTHIEAMKLALEALEYLPEMQGVEEAITALRQAIEQAEQAQPVATLEDLEQEIYENTREFVPRNVMDWMLKRYYTAPPQRQSLTEEQLRNLMDDLEVGGEIAKDFARAIEAAHGIKENT
jgi:Mg2+ and Co2+ transporter CorA